MKYLMLILTGILIFGATAGISWYLQQRDAALAAPKDLPETSPATLESTSEPLPEIAAHQEPLPVAVRPRPMSVEEIVKYSLSLKKQEQSLAEREQSLQQMEERQKLARADIQIDQQQFTSLLANVAEQQAAATALIDQAQQSRSQLAEEAQAAASKKQLEDQARIIVEQEQQENVKRLSTWMQAMEPDKAAEVLKQFAEDGRLEIAVQILANFEEREAAEILSSLQDPKLIGEFVDAYRNLKQPEKANSKRR